MVIRSYNHGSYSPTGFTYGYYHDVYTVKTSPSRYHARLGSMRTTTTTTTTIC